MSDAPPPSMTLLAALDLVRNKQAAELTAEDVTGLRARLEASPGLFATVGGPAAVEQFLAQAEAALADAPANAVSSPPRAATDAAVVPPSDPRQFRRRVEVTAYAMIVLAAVAGLYYVLRNVSPPTLAEKASPASAASQSTAASASTDSPPENSSQEPEAEAPPDPAAEPSAPNVWRGWQMATAKDSAIEKRDQWDLNDPGKPLLSKTLLATGGPLRLFRTTSIGAADRWLMVYARPAHAAVPAGFISVLVDGQQTAKAVIGGGESDWPLYVPLSPSGNSQRRLEIVFTPGTPQQQIVFWNVELAESQRTKPQPESPLIAALRSADPTVRVQGATDAAQSVDLLALGALIRVLGDENRDVRRAAVLTLAKYNAGAPPFVVDALTKKLHDADPEIRRLAAQTLMVFDADCTWVALSHALLNHADSPLRLQIAQQLAGRRHPVVRATFEKLLTHEDDVLRGAAVNSIISMPDPEIVPLLIRALADPEPAVGRAAAAALVSRRDAAAETALIGAIQSHPDSLVRRTAVTRFHAQPSAQALPALRAALDSPDDALRRSAVPALAKLPGDEVDALLLQLSKSPDWNVRYSAVEVLATRPGKAADEALLACLASGQEAWQRRLAIRRFSQPVYVTSSVIPALREALKSSSATVRHEIFDALHNVRLAKLQQGYQQRLTRAQSLDVLAAPPWSETFTLMVQGLDDAVPRARAAAAGVLRGDPHPDADAIMPRLMSSSDVQIRQLAAGRFPNYAVTNSRMMDFYKQCLKDPDAVVRTCAVTALSPLRTAESRALINSVVDDPAFSVREAVLRTWPLDAAHVRDEALLPANAKGNGPNAVAALVKLLNDPKPSVRNAASQRLLQIPGQAADQALLAALKSHTDVVVLRNAAQGLGRVPMTPSGLETLREQLRHPDRELRETALRLAFHRAGADAVSMISPLLADPSASVRLTAATMLSQSPTPAAEEVVLTLLSHPDWQIRQQAVQRFARLPMPRAIPGLGVAAAMPELEIRLEALRALGQFKEPAIFPFLAHALDDPEPEARGVASEILRGRVEPESVEVMLRALASHPHVDVRHQAAAKFEAQPNPAALPALIVAAKHEDDNLRLTSLRALGRLGDAAATAALAEALNDSVPEVRLGAATQLVGRRDDHSESALLSVLAAHKDVEVRRLAASRFQAIPSPRAIPALAQATQDADDLLRIAAVTALQNTATPEAIEPLIAALSDGNTNVRNLALAALSGRNDPRAQAAANAFKARTGMGR